MAFYYILNRGGVKFSISLSSVMTNVLLIISIVLLFLGSDYTAWIIIALGIFALDSIDLKSNDSAKKEHFLIKKLSIIFRVFLSLAIVLLISTDYFTNTETAPFLNIFLLVPLIILVLSSRFNKYLNRTDFE